MKRRHLVPSRPDDEEKVTVTFRITRAEYIAVERAAIEQGFTITTMMRLLIKAGTTNGLVVRFGEKK